MTEVSYSSTACLMGLVTSSLTARCKERKCRQCAGLVRRVGSCRCGTIKTRRGHVTVSNRGLLAAGSIYIPAFAPANYTFYMDSDDGSLLMIDGTVVISDPGAVLGKQLVINVSLLSSVSPACHLGDELWCANLPPCGTLLPVRRSACEHRRTTAMIHAGAARMPLYDVILLENTAKGRVPRLAGLCHLTPSVEVCAGAHGFSGNGGKSGTVLLVPGAHDFRIDYVQVPTMLTTVGVTRLHAGHVFPLRM